MLIDYYNSSLSKLLNSILYRILLFLCCSDIIQIGRVNYHMLQQRQISLSASLWLKLYWITTVDFQQWWRKEGSRNSFAVKLLLVVVSICVSNSILLAAGLYYACFSFAKYYLIVQTEITCVHQSCGESVALLEEQNLTQVEGLHLFLKLLTPRDMSTWLVSSVFCWWPELHLVGERK